MIFRGAQWMSEARSANVQQKIFHIFSAEGQTAYIPANRLLRIAADPKSSLVTIYFEGDFAVIVDALDGTAVDVAERLVEDLTSSHEDWVYLNPKISNVTGIRF